MQNTLSWSQSGLHTICDCMRPALRTGAKAHRIGMVVLVTVKPKFIKMPALVQCYQFEYSENEATILLAI